MLKRIEISILFLYNEFGDNMKKKILYIFLKIIIFIVIIIGIIILINILNSKQIISKDIKNISITCLDTNKENVLKEDEVVKYIPHLVGIYKIKDSNFNKWDLVPKIKIVINKKDVLKITDYDEAYYYGYFNDYTVKIPKEVYNYSKKYCEEDNDGQK